MPGYKYQDRFVSVHFSETAAQVHDNKQHCCVNRASAAHLAVTFITPSNRRTAYVQFWGFSLQQLRNECYCLVTFD